MTIRILKEDGTWSVISGGGRGVGSDIYYADILGSPTESTALKTALDSKLNANLGTTSSGKVLKVGATGDIESVEYPVVNDTEGLKF